MEGEERKDGGAAVPREDREDRGNGLERQRREEDRGNGVERKRREEDRGNGAGRKRREEDRVERKRREEDHGNGEDRKRREREPYYPPREEGDGERRRGHRGGSRSRSDSLQSAERKKKRIEESKRQESTIFVGDLDPETTAEQLTGLFKRFGCVLSSKIKENHCYGFVTFEKKESAEAAIAAGQKQDGIELLNGKQVYVSWALGSLPEWKKGIGGFTVSPGKDLLHGHRSRKGVVKPSVLAAATAAAAAKANAVLASMDRASLVEPRNDHRGRAIVAYDDLL